MQILSIVSIYVFQGPKIFDDKLHSSLPRLYFTRLVLDILESVTKMSD